MNVSANRAVVVSVSRLLRPIVRLLIRRGITSEVLEELVRATFVDVADQEFSIPNKKQSAARISVLTGLHRREVARLRKDGESAHGASQPRYSRIESVLAAWIRESPYLDAKGDPRALAFDGADSFSELVERFGRDVTPRAVADELLRIGNVAHTATGELILNARGYRPSATSDEMVDVFGVHGADLLLTIESNMTTEAASERLFQRQVVYNRIAEDQLPAFKSLSARLGQRVLEDLDEWLNQHRVPDQIDEPTLRVGLSIFQIVGASQPDDD